MALEKPPAHDKHGSLTTGDTVLVTRTLPDGQRFRFLGTLDLTAPEGGFTVVGEDLDSGLRTTGYFLVEDDTPGLRQDVVAV
ncbi:hypothetical protein [Streptomyces zaomyceticus]|uniref:hypothetical protein n=1 Tax=Streptomyces zaomyceticus TaxID=68286 RepID=UPI0036908823